MCGIVGFVDFTKKSSKQVLNEMGDELAHRGPDAANYFFEEKEKYQIGLGHRRLSIIDLNTSANQPMPFGDWIIIFNGEIYNYNELKEELMKRGRLFSTHSDTEVILQAFDEWGEGSVQKFIGMFAFVLYNKSSDVVYTVRDRTGIKPLFVYNNGNTIFWASELKSFHKHPSFKKELNLESVKSFVQLGYVPSPNSIFLNVSKQGPGSICKYDLKSGTKSSTKYWDVGFFYRQGINKIDYGEAKTEMISLLTSACQYRMVSDVPVGVFLSGGYDSTLVTSILQTTSSGRIKTFTIGVTDPDLNEAKFAKEIANRLGTEHTEIYLTEKELDEQLKDFSFFYDEPFGDSSAIPTMLVSQMAREKVKVALSADGGDELFAGYNRYDFLPSLNRIRRLRKIPFLKSLIASATKDRYKRFRLQQLFTSPDAITLAMLLNNPYYNEEADGLFNRKISNIQIDPQREEDWGADDLRSILSFDYQTYLLNDIMVKVDRATMRYGLEGREPLLDHRLVEYTANLPNEFKIKNGIKKYILKDIVHDYIPKELMERPKMGFAAPVKHWLHNTLREKVDYFFSEAYIDSQGIFSFKNINLLKQNYYSGKDKYSIKMWYLLAFQMWYDRWMR